MKKITTLVLGAILGLVFSASASQVFLNTSNNYDVKIDNRFYTVANSSVNLNPGTHTLQVYQVTAGTGIFGIGKKRTLVSSSQFNLGNADLTINVDQYGQARISGNGYDQGQGGNGRWNNGNGNQNNGNNGNWNNGNQNNNQNRGNWDNGRGRKKGHYKHHDDGDRNDHRDRRDGDRNGQYNNNNNNDNRRHDNDHDNDRP